MKRWKKKNKTLCGIALMFMKSEAYIGGKKKINQHLIRLTGESFTFTFQLTESFCGFCR